MSVLICARVNDSRKPFPPNIVLLFVVAALLNKDPLRRVPLCPHLKTEQRFFERHLENPGSSSFIPDSIRLLHMCTLALFVLL